MCQSQAVSIVFFTDSWRPDSFYPRIAANRQRGLHTLCLLDIKVKEPSLESLARGRKVPPSWCQLTLAPCTSHLKPYELPRLLLHSHYANRQDASSAWNLLIDAGVQDRCCDCMMSSCSQSRGNIMQGHAAMAI